MSAIQNPAFLVFPPVKRRVYFEPAHHSRRRLYMTSKPLEGKTTKPSNGMSAPVPQSTESRSSGTGKGVVVSMAVAEELGVVSLRRRLLLESRRGLEVSQHGLTVHLAYGGSEAFVFPYGCLVIWGGVDNREFYEMLVEQDAVGWRPTPILSERDWVAGGGKSLHADVIVTEADANGIDPVLERLAISCALAQGIKLRAFESYIHKTVNDTRELSQHLAQTGEVTTSRQEISRTLGSIFLERCRYHLSGDILATPELFHDNERYLPSYRRVEQYLGIRERGKSLIERVEALQDFYKLLGDEVTHHYSIGLELAITIMIAFEIFLSLLALAKQNFRTMFSGCTLFLCILALVWLAWGRLRKRGSATTTSKLSKSSTYLQRLFERLPPGVP